MDSHALAAATFVATNSQGAGSTESTLTFLSSIGLGTDGTLSATYTGVTAEVDTATFTWVINAPADATCS